MWHSEASIALGKHIWTVTPGNMKTNAKLLYAVIQVYAISIMLTKLSFLFQYSRVFQHTRLRIWWAFVGVIVVIQALLGVFATIFSCSPVAFFWDWSIPGGKCLPQKPVYSTTAALNLATDLAIFASPIPLVAHLHLPTKQKWSVAAIFLLGSCTCIIAIIKITTFSKGLQTKDPTWDFVEINLWSTIELDVGIICACLASFKPLIARYFPRALFTGIFGTFVVSAGKTEHFTATQGNLKWPEGLSQTHTGSTGPVDHSDEIPLADPKESWSAKGDCEAVAAPVSASASYRGER
ncbi:hypothetical protein ACJQWK_06537 [Exserohilum turcicum]